MLLLTVDLIFTFQASLTTRTHTHRVPDHDELMMADTQCRMCGNILRSVQDRRRHELLTHRLTIIDGETFSTTPYVMPFVASSVSSSAPLVQTSSVSTSTSSAVPTQSGSLSGPASSQSGTASPATLSAASTGSSGSGSLPTPTLFLTPSPGLQTTRRSSAAVLSRLPPNHLMILETENAFTVFITFHPMLR